MYGSQNCIGAKADYHREDFVFARTQSRTMQNLPWEHPSKHTYLPWVTPARRQHRAHILRNVTVTIVALLMGALLTPPHHHTGRATEQVAAAQPVHTTIMASNTR